MTTNSVKASGPSTKDRLNSIVRDFDDFDSEMKIGTRQRREKEEYKIAELKTEMNRLDQDLTAEIKRRTEMNKSTQNWFEENLAQANEVVLSRLAERNDEMTSKFDKLNTRITDLESHFEKEKISILAQIDERGRELAALLNKFKEEFDIDRKQRLERESHIVKQLTDHEHVVEGNFEKQIQTRESRYAALKAVLEDNIKLRSKAEDRFQNFFEQEIHKLQNEVQLEAETRENEDDEIVEALNRYTMKLQSSLKIINSTEM